VAVDAFNVSSAAGAATDGATEIIPKPKAATATSAMRLRSVFVDICFLSISRSEEFPPSAWVKVRPLICHERAFMGSYFAVIR